MMTVNTLGEVPDADGYIIELGMEDTDHPAGTLDEDEIRDKMGLGEWYVRTADPEEEQELISQVDKQIDHARLPAYLILGSHPEDATEAVVIYLDGIEDAENAWAALEEAIDALRNLSTENSDGVSVSQLSDYLTSKNALLAMSLSSDAIQHIQFAGIA